MAFDAFIKIDGIEGESTDADHKGWIEIKSFRSGVSQRSSATASSVGGASSERADFRNFNFIKEVDKATPKLGLACAAGTHINTILVEVCRAGDEKVKFLEYELTNCIICDSSIDGADAGAEGGFPKENVSINYGKITWNYTQQKREGGSPAGSIMSGWDLQQNCKL
jgi:type VI secretion system secreted protein Hcp